MNFQKVTPVDNAETLLDIAFRKAGEKKVAAAKVDVVTAQLQNRLGRIIKDFPSYNTLPFFYQKLMDLTLDVDKFRKSLGSIQWAITQVRTLHKKYRKDIQSLPRTEHKAIIKRFYGRVSSVLHQIDRYLTCLYEYRRILKTYPDIKDLFTVCLYGFPNVGKSTFLNLLCNSKAETADYAFTTKSINAGYFEVSGEKIQILDVPGTLARKEKMNQIELQADLVLDHVADLVIFVFDYSEYCGYSIADQEKLLHKIKEKKDVLVYISKKDMLTAKQLETFPYTHYSQEEIIEEIQKRLSNYTNEKDFSPRSKFVRKN